MRTTATSGAAAALGKAALTSHIASARVAALVGPAVGSHPIVVHVLARRDHEESSVRCNSVCDDARKRGWCSRAEPVLRSRTGVASGLRSPEAGTGRCVLE